MRKTFTVFVACLTMLLLVGCSDTSSNENGDSSPTAVTGAPDVSQAAATTDVWTATAEGDLETIKWHLDEGTDVNIRHPQSGGSLLGTAALFEQPEIADFRIKQGANVNAKSNDGATALHAAVFFGHNETTELLINQGADVNARNNKGESPLDITKVDWQTTQFIAGLLQVSVEQEQVEAGRTKCSALLTQKGAKPSGGGGLLAAIRTQDTEAVKMALAKDADLETPDPQLGITPLNWASLLGNVEIARMLIKKGADINGPNRDGVRPLHSAAFLGRTSIVELLLSKGADANAKNDKGETPLTSATTGDEAIQFIAGLLKIQINVNAARQGRAKCVALLKQGGEARE